MAIARARTERERALSAQSVHVCEEETVNGFMFLFCMRADTSIGLMHVSAAERTPNSLCNITIEWNCSMFIKSNYCVSGMEHVLPAVDSTQIVCYRRPWPFSIIHLEWHLCVPLREWGQVRNNHV